MMLHGFVLPPGQNRFEVTSPEDIEIPRIQEFALADQVILMHFVSNT